MRADVPASVLEMLKIPGLAPEKVCASTSSSRSHPSMSWSRPANKTGSPRARALVRRCKRRCCKASSSCAVHKVSASSTMPTSSSGRCGNLGVSHPELRRIAMAGDLRRGCELVSHLALVAETPDGPERRSSR